MIRTLVYDWNQVENKPSLQATLLDETLRDGLQSPSVRYPTIEQKLQILHLIEALGIDSVNIGLPGAGPGLARSSYETRSDLRARSRTLGLSSRRTVPLER